MQSFRSSNILNDDVIMTWRYSSIKASWSFFCNGCHKSQSDPITQAIISIWQNAPKRSCTNYTMKMLCAKHCLKAQSSLRHNFTKANRRCSLPTSFDFAIDGCWQWVPPCNVVLHSSVWIPAPTSSIGMVVEMPPGVASSPILPLLFSPLTVVLTPLLVSVASAILAGEPRDLMRH